MSMQTTMEQKSDSVPLMNGNGRLAEEDRKSAPARFWRKIHMNEWTFSLSLLVFSFSIVLGKLFTNYGKLSWQNNDQYSLPSVTRFTALYSTMPSVSALSQFDMKQIPVDSEKFFNASNLYAEAAANALVTVYGKYDWLLKAMMNGLVLTSFSWFILYKDSSEPGINPPFPFSPSRQRRHEGSRIQLNYLVGALNGLLLFIYMCL
ncbi:uncharacterized protein [Linepithema humile]|uniref:uncharacterized protein n=1 Tax=Linepithema humile TaxID=83485 RepID=UPI00062321B4|nr:PREDICTED: uncharacterized protein LOC105674537 [Linepithema humile]